MAKPRKKAAAPEAPPGPQVGDKVRPDQSVMVYEILKVHHGGEEVDLHVPGTISRAFACPSTESLSSNVSLQSEPPTLSRLTNQPSMPPNCWSTSRPSNAKTLSGRMATSTHSQDLPEGHART